MTISHTQNLEAHYITSDKTQRPDHLIAQPPTSIPKTHLFDDKDANERLKAINQDIYDGYKKEDNREKNNFIIFLSSFVVGTLLISLFRGFFKKS